MVDIRTFLLKLIVGRNALESGALVDHFFGGFGLREYLLFEPQFALLHQAFENSVIGLRLECFLLFLTVLFFFKLHGFLLQGS